MVVEYRKLILPIAAGSLILVSYSTEIDAGFKDVMKKVGKGIVDVARAKVTADSLAAEEAKRQAGTNQAPVQQPSYQNPQQSYQAQQRTSWMDEEKYYDESELMTAQEVAKYLSSIVPYVPVNVRITKHGANGNIANWRLMNSKLLADMDSEANVFVYGGHRAAKRGDGGDYILEFEKMGIVHTIIIPKMNQTEWYIDFLNGSGTNIANGNTELFQAAAPYFDGCGEIEVTAGGVSHGEAQYSRVSYRGKGNGKKFAVGWYQPRNSIGAELFEGESALRTDFEDNLRFSGGGNVSARELGGQVPRKIFIQRSQTSLMPPP